MTVEIGAIDDTLTVFQNNLGHPAPYSRYFVSSSTSVPPGGEWATIATRASQGYWMHISFKSSLSWASVAAGNENSRLDQIGTFLNSIPAHTPHPHLWSFSHEPDNDGLDAQNLDFQAAFNKAVERIGARAPNWLSCMVYTMGTVQSGSHGGTAAWWPSAAQVFGADYYFRRGADSFIPWADPNVANSGPAALPPENFYQTHSGRISAWGFAQSKGVPIVIPEFGISIKNPATNGGNVVVQQDRAALIQDRANKWRDLADFWGINSYERDSVSRSGFRNYCIGDGSRVPVCNDPYSLAAFYSFTQGVAALPPLVSSFTPTSGIVGTAVTITGTNFTGATSVRFNGVIAAYTVLSPTTITATVPTGATTGPIRVQSVAGFDDSNPFTVGAPRTFLGSVSPPTRVKAAS